jgi:hypothetical protein
MFCPRCGTQNEPGDRFCSSCGATLREISGSSQPRATLGQRVGRLFGTTRKARMLSLGTLIALVIAVVAFIALKPSEDDSIPRDAYTISADRLCVESKRQIVTAERQALRKPSGPDSGFAALVPVVSNWRSDFEAKPVPTDRVDQARALSVALREIEIELSGLAVAAEEGSRARTLSRAKQVDEASRGVEKAVAALALSECARETIGFAKPTKG